MVSSVEFEPSPYSVLVLHCLKYPSKGVLGLLLGTHDGDKVTVSGCVPLVHESAPLAPPLEIGLALVSEHSDRDKKIVGVYYSNDSLRDKEVNPHAARLAEKVAVVAKRAPLLAQVVNSELSPDCSNQCLEAYTHDDGHTWTNISVLVDESALNCVSDAVHRKLYREVVDFENHLDDPQLDFFNVDLVSRLEEAL